jgi:hypothetical protein
MLQRVPEATVEDREDVEEFLTFSRNAPAQQEISQWQAVY